MKENRFRRAFWWASLILLCCFMYSQSVSAAQQVVVKTMKQGCNCSRAIPLSGVNTCTPKCVCTVYNFWNCAGDKDCDCIPDSLDKCPMHKENYNGIDDQDGCPDELVPMVVIDKVVRDSDNDGIVDEDDKCPFTPEDVNGFMDSDGCPDNGPPPKYVQYLNTPQKNVRSRPRRSFPSYGKQKFVIHLSSYSSLKSAMREATMVNERLGIPTCISRSTVNGKNWYRTVVGPYSSKEKARKVLYKIQRAIKWIKSPLIKCANKFSCCCLY